MLHQIRYDYIICKKGNYILSDAHFSGHQEYTSHMIYASFLIEKNVKCLKKHSATEILYGNNLILSDTE